jgi:CarD family transcriptional regulator
VVHPSHGVGRVARLEQRAAGGSAEALFYVLEIADSSLKVMVSVTAADAVGLRDVMSPAEAEGVLLELARPEVAVDVQPWAKRQRVYAEMMKTGAPLEVARVLRDMLRLRADKDLSFGERRLLDQAKARLAHELARTLGRRVDELMADLERAVK